MKSIEELQAELKQIYADLEERRMMEQESVPQTINFDELSSKAERYKIENHPMSGKSEREQEMYLLLLLSVVSLDSNAYEKSFSLLYRISHGMGFKGNVQELFLKAQQMNFNTIDEITRIFINDDIRLVLLMECILISQCFQKEKKKATEYIAELCMLMKLEKDYIILISNIARVILTQDVNEYKCYIKNTYEIFNCYLKLLENQFEFHIYRYLDFEGVCFDYSGVYVNYHYRFSDGMECNLRYNDDIFRLTAWIDGTDSPYYTLTLKEYKLDSNEFVCYYPEHLIYHKGNPFLITSINVGVGLAYGLAKQKFKEAGGIIE